jgi:hypothetical protein
VIRLQPYRKARSRSVGRRSRRATLPRRGRPSGQDRPDDGAGWGRARVCSGPSAGATSGRVGGLRGLAHAAIADNVISNRVKSPASEGTPWASRSPSSAAAAPIPRSSSRVRRRATRLPIDELVLLDIDPERLAIVGGLARGCSTTRLGRPAGRSRRSRGGHRRRRFRAHPAARRRPGRAADRRDAAADFGSSARRRPVPAGFAKALRTVPLVLELAELTGRRARPAPGSSTSRTRSGS